MLPKKPLLAALLTFCSLVAACSPVAMPDLLSVAEMQTAIAGTVHVLVTRTPEIPDSGGALPNPAVETGTLEPSTTPTPSPTPPGVPLPSIDEAACVPEENPTQIGLVTNIVDGDTIDVDVNGQVYRVRYIGIDTPESTTQVEPFGEQASAANRGLVEGQAVILVRDVNETDRFGRLLRFVFVGNTFVNYELVRQGYATVSTFPPDVACQETFLAAEREARESGRGLWGIAAAATDTLPAPPTATWTPAPVLPIPTATNKPAWSCHPSYPSVCLAPDAGDYDCQGGSGNGPNYVGGPITVLPPDPFGLDGDGDGVGCE